MSALVCLFKGTYGQCVARNQDLVCENHIKDFLNWMKFNVSYVQKGGRKTDGILQTLYTSGKPDLFFPFKILNAPNATGLLANDDQVFCIDENSYEIISNYVNQLGIPEQSKDKITKIFIILLQPYRMIFPELCAQAEQYYTFLSNLSTNNPYMEYYKNITYDVIDQTGNIIKINGKYLPKFYQWLFYHLEQSTLTNGQDIYWKLNPTHILDCSTKSVRSVIVDDDSVAGFCYGEKNSTIVTPIVILSTKVTSEPKVSYKLYSKNRVMSFNFKDVMKIC